MLDPIYFSLTRLQYLCPDRKGDGVFRVRLTRYKGKDVVLSNGVLICKNDLLLKIHLYNVRLLQGFTYNMNELLKGKGIFRRVTDSMPLLAEFVLNHPEETRIKGTIGITLINKGFRPLGFECVLPENKFYSRFKKIQQPIVDNIPGIEAGPMWTQAAIESVIPGFGGLFVAIAIFFFAFTTLMAYYYISETTLFYLGRKRNLKGLKVGLMILFLGMIYFGSVQNASLLWGLSDFGFGSMVWLNLVAILMLTKTALKVFKDYEKQKKAGIEPVFDPVKLGIKGADFWEEKIKEDNLKAKKKIEEKQSVKDNTLNF
jgi:hypothetical protein